MSNNYIYTSQAKGVPGANKKLSIPSVNAGTLQNNAVEATRFFDAVKQNLDIITGRGNGVEEIPSLADNANTAQIIAVVNAILRHINASGE